MKMNYSKMQTFSKTNVYLEIKKALDTENLFLNIFCLQLGLKIIKIKHFKSLKMN